jgi:hypothetical protein
MTRAAKVVDPRKLIADAEAGLLTPAQIKKAADEREASRGRDGVVLRLRAILQARRGSKATEDLSAAAESEPGRPLWAYAQLGATHLNNFAMSWAGRKADGSLVISLWRVRQPPSFVRGDDGRWLPTTAAKHSSETTREQVRRTGVRTTFYDALENVVNTKRAVVEAIVSSPENQAATTWKRVDSRPWLDTDGTPVRLRVANVDRGADRYDVELAEGKTLRCCAHRPSIPPLLALPVEWVCRFTVP